MNIILLDKDSRRFKASISQFESFIWTERYWEYGDFELVVPLNVRNVSLIGLDDYLKIPTSDTLMIVENIEYVSPVKDEGGKFNITGRSLDSILDRRILFQDYKRSIKAEAFITQMVKACFKDSSNSDRSIDYLYIEENNDPDVETDPVKVDESKGSNLGDIILKSSKDNELGFRINFKNDGSFHFEVFAGKDKKYIVFSENNLLLEEAKVYQSNTDLKTFALVSGADSDISVNIEGSPTGINRRETYSGSYTINKTDPGYRNELELKGKNDLEDHIVVKTIEGQLLNIGKYRLRRDFDLGDLITIQNPYYKATARITEVIQSWNQEGYLIYPGFIAKDITVANYIQEEIELPEEEESEPETPEIPDDQTPKRLINVEIISAIKTFTNIESGRTSGKAYQQIYIPNVQPGDESRPIKRFGVRLRGLLPEGLNPNIYSICCDVFLGSEDKIGTIKLDFISGTESYVTDWYSYLIYDSPYIRLYFYVICKVSGYEVQIGQDEQPFIDGFVDIKLNNVEGLIYEPTETGDDLSYQVGYYWEATANFNKYYIGNSTNVNGIDGIEIFIKRAISLGNESILPLLGESVINGNRGYEYDTVELDNTTLTPIESGIVTVPPYEQNFKIPPFGDNVVEQSCQSIGFRDNMFEYIERTGSNYLFGKGNNLQEVNMVLRKKYFYDESTISYFNSEYRYKTKLHIDNLNPRINSSYFSIGLNKVFLSYVQQSFKNTITIKLNRPFSDIKIEYIKDSTKNQITNDHDLLYTITNKYEYGGTYINYFTEGISLWFNNQILSEDPYLDIEITMDIVINERPGYPKFSGKNGEESDIFNFSYNIPNLRTNQMIGSYNVDSLSYPCFDDTKKYWLSLLLDTGNYFMEGYPRYHNLWGVYIYDDSDNIVSAIYENYHDYDSQGLNEPELIGFSDKNKIGIRITINITTETNLSSVNIGGTTKSSSFGYKLIKISNSSEDNSLYNYLLSDLINLSLPYFNSQNVFNDIVKRNSHRCYVFDNTDGKIKIMVLVSISNSTKFYDIYDEHDTLINFRSQGYLSSGNAYSSPFNSGSYYVYDVSNIKTIQIKNKKVNYRYGCNILINPISYETKKVSDTPLKFYVNPLINLSGDKSGYIPNTVDQDNYYNSIFGISSLGIKKKIDISFTPNMTTDTKKLLEDRTYLKIKDVKEEVIHNSDGTNTMKYVYNVYDSTNYDNAVSLNDYTLPYKAKGNTMNNPSFFLFIGQYLNSVENEDDIPKINYPNISITYKMFIEIREKEV